MVSLPGIVFGAILGYLANKLFYGIILLVALLLVQIRALVKNT